MKTAQGNSPNQLNDWFLKSNTGIYAMFAVLECPNTLFYLVKVLFLKIFEIGFILCIQWNLMMNPTIEFEVQKCISIIFHY